MRADLDPRMEALSSIRPLLRHLSATGVNQRPLFDYLLSSQFNSNSVPTFFHLAAKYKGGRI